MSGSDPPMFFDPSEGTFQNSLRHVRKDLLSKRFETHEGSLTDRFQSLLLDCWHARHLQKPLCMMQASEKTPSLAACSQPKPSLGARKIEPRRLERQKCLRCGAEKNRQCRRCIEAPCAFHHNNPIFFLSNGCHLESKREVVVAYMLCSLS